MQLIINGKKAVLKKGTSFDFVAENRSFSGSDGYTLSISLPLAGCYDNIDIFGHANRIDADFDDVKMDAIITDRSVTLYGTVAVTERNASEVKIQFLEGRSAQNFDTTFDDIYINELDLGSYPLTSLPDDPTTQWMGLMYGQEAVALPWVNNSSGNIQNDVVYENNAYKYNTTCVGLSYQPYLIVIVKRICDVLGYSCDLSQWDATEDFRYLLICNTLPYAWDVPQFARALPHWSVSEFFEKLEPLLNGEFDIDHRAKTIKFAFVANTLAGVAPVHIDKVVKTFTTTLTEEDESNYVESANRRFSECDHNMWSYYCCPWFIKDNAGSIIEYDTLDALIEANKACARIRSYGRGMTEVQSILYAKNVDTYFIVRSIRREFIETNSLGRDVYDNICVLQPVNVFGDKITSEDSSNDIEIEFVPAWIDETEESKGNCLFLDVASFSEDETGGSRPADAGTEKDPTEIQQTPIALRLQEGEKESKSEYFDKIHLAFWDGAIDANDIGKLPCPAIDWVTMHEDWTYTMIHFSMRLSTLQDKVTYKINPKQKFRISFLSDDIPDVRAVFYIEGKAFICEKITATFTEDGMSQLLKGEFYLLDE